MSVQDASKQVIAHLQPLMNGKVRPNPEDSDQTFLTGKWLHWRVRLILEESSWGTVEIQVKSDKDLDHVHFSLDHSDQSRLEYEAERAEPDEGWEDEDEDEDERHHYITDHVYVYGGDSMAEYLDQLQRLPPALGEALCQSLEESGGSRVGFWDDTLRITYWKVLQRPNPAEFTHRQLNMAVKVMAVAEEMWR